MHIDVPETEAGRSRAVVRFSVGVTLALALALIYNWPAGHATTVFTALLLIEPQPLPFGRAVRLICHGLLGVLSSLAFSHLLVPYPLLVLIILTLVLYRIFVFLARGGFVLNGGIWLASFVILPYFAQFHPGVSVTVAGGLVVNVVVAYALHWVGFLVIPSPEAPRLAHGHEAPPAGVIHRIAARAALTLMVMLMANMALQWGTILAVIYTALIALSMSADASWSVGKEKLVGNLVGGLFAIVAYYVILATPNLLLALLLVGLAIAYFAQRAFSHSPWSGAWFGAFIGFMLILSGSLAPSGKDADVKALARIFEIGLAAAYVYGAYRVIDLVQEVGAAIAGVRRRRLA